MPTSRLTVSSPARPSFRRPAGEGGFTLIEVLVSALMLALIAGATATALIATSHVSGDQRLRSEAQQLVNADQDRLRGYSDEQLGQLNGHPTRQTVVGGTTGKTFTITSSSNYEDSTGSSSCSSQAAVYYKVISTVSWTEPYSSRTDTNVSAESLVARPVTGDLLTNVQDQTGAALPGVTVKATGPSQQSGQTDGNGCVLFAGLGAGAYTATASKTGYVDTSGNASPTASATVALTGTAKTTPATFHLGLAGSLSLATPQGFTTATTGVYGEADALSWLGSGASGGMPNGFQTTTAATPQQTGLATAALYPFDVAATGAASYTNNYGAWAGRCLQQEPPTGYDTFNVAPGSTLSATVIEPELLLTSVTYTTSGTPSTTTAVRPAHVKLTFASTSGTSCSYSWYPTVATGAMPATGWLKYPGQPFASQNTTGSTASASSTSSSPQAGKLTVCADYKDPSSGVYYNAKATGVNNYNMSASGNAVPTIAIKQGGTSGQC